MHSTPFHQFPQHCLWNSSNVHQTDDDPLVLSKFKEDHGALLPLSMPLSSRRFIVWCPWHCVPAGSVSSSSTLQIFWDASHLWWMLCLPVYLLSHFPSLQHVQGSTSTVVLKGRGWPLTYSSLGFPLLLLTFCSKLTESVRMMALWSDRHLLRQTSGGYGWLIPPPLSNWRMKCTGCTVFMDGGHTLLDNEAPLHWLHQYMNVLYKLQFYL